MQFERFYSLNDSVVGSFPHLHHLDFIKLSQIWGNLSKDDARRRHATTGNATTSRRMRGKHEERRQRTRANGASIGRGCALRGGGSVERMRGRGINVTTSRQTRD
jgi:hypothetical protein